MSALKDQILADMKGAMKARDKGTLSALRMLKAAIQTEEVSGAKHELDDAEVLRVIEREVKRRRESAATYREAGRPELAEREEAEAAVFARYQPAQLADAELAELVDAVVAEVCDGEPAMRDMGRVMREAKDRAGGAVDGRRLSEAVKARLARG
ncbi:GatB/YqeY domain-containing protein [Corynebacterium sphenisci]|uniref:GatB/YqeY domain-containing protein n=1 Tax=Corynebacterium sphenisci TaxID=191493 RepID=UPI0026DF2EBB|nr:GatB/YqeY domain-containing protein [Corynebacterium sphenisci]MDO5730950.1 GatB/YqeY domain-containing protein [Corynebacterium sphenisci]